jgi:hypothetical protein
MVVLTEQRRSGHSGVIGLNIGAANVTEHFPPGTEFIELELDHLRIVCTLPPSFWLDQPEIHDLRLSSWLEAKRNSGKLGRQPSPVAMVPCGAQKFRLQPVPPIEVAVPRPAVPLAQLATHVAAVLPTLVPSLDRRRYSAGHAPERRRVGRLVSDERASTPANH